MQLSNKEQAAQHKTYTRIQKMRELKDKQMPHFAGPDGERSFNQYIDDSERVINGYIMSRDAQDKEGWQSNMLDNVARAKMRAVASSVGLKVPDIRCEAISKDAIRDPGRAQFAKYISKQTFSEGNPTLHNFLEVWHLLSHGFIVEYDGYKTGGAKQRRVKSFDSRTGEVEVVEEYVEFQGRPYNVILNPQEFYWWEFNVRDVQDQPHIAWVQHYTKTQLEREFSKFPNYSQVLDKKAASQLSDNETLYFKQWSKNVESENDYEVIRFYSKEDDLYEIWCNGVPLLLAPLLWGHEEKYYPFAKSIGEPFANSNFFVGMSFAAMLESITETRSTVLNTMVDKLYRSMETPLLVGLQNKDLLDWENESVSQDGRYYVPDVNAVKPLDIKGIQQGEMAFLQVLDRGIEQLSIDARQQGQNPQGEQPTARAAIIADERARELKGMLYLFLEDLWYQKYVLRNRTVLTHYLKDKAVKKDLRDSIISIKDFHFGTGDRGVLDIHIAKNEAALLDPVEIEAREQAAQQLGLTYKLVSLPVDYMDGWHYDYEIIPGSFHNQDRLRQETELDNEVQWLATFNPQFLVANIDGYTSEKLELRGKHMEDYNPPQPMPQMPMTPEGAPAEQPEQPAQGVLGLQ